LLVWIFGKISEFIFGKVIGGESSWAFGINLGVLIILTIIFVAWNVISKFLKYVLILGWAFVVLRIILALSAGI
jgi:hypothetical protein